MENKTETQLPEGSNVTYTQLESLKEEMEKDIFEKIMASEFPKVSGKIRNHRSKIVYIYPQEDKYKGPHIGISQSNF